MTKTIKFFVAASIAFVAADCAAAKIKDIGSISGFRQPLRIALT